MENKQIYGFAFALAAVLLLLTSITIAIQVVIDPENRYNLINIPVLEAKKSALVLSGEDKTNLIQNTDATCIVLGTSRSELGINPLHISEYSPHFDCINLSKMNSSTEDMLDILQYARHFMKIEAVFWGLDYEMFTARYGRVRNHYQYTDSVTSERPSIKELLSYKNVIDAIALMFDEPIEGSVDHFSNGQLRQTRWSRSYERNGHAGLFHRTERMFVRKNIYLVNKDRIYQKRYGRSFEALEEILTIIEEDNIKFYPFISPVHIRQLLVVEASNRFDQYQQWKRDLFTNISTNNKHDLYNFSFLENITVEAVPEDQTPMQWYWESSHYKEVLGDYLLELMHTNKGDRYKLNAENITVMGELELLLLDSYKKEHPDVVNKRRRGAR